MRRPLGMARVADAIAWQPVVLTYVYIDVYIDVYITYIHI